MRRALLNRFHDSKARHRLRVYLTYGLGIAAVICIVLMTLPYFIPLQRVQQAAAIKMSSLTGQDVTFSGAARSIGFPLPVFTLRNVQIAGSADGPALLRAPKIEAELKLFPLLRGDVEIAGISVIEPKIILNTDAEGRSNWRSSSSLLVLFNPQQLATQSVPPAAMRIGEVRIVNGTISFTQDGANPRTRFTDVNVALYWPEVTKRFEMRGAMLREGLPVRFSAMLRRPAALFAKDISPFEMTIDTSALRAQLSGDLFAVPQLQADAALTLTSPSLRDLARWSIPNPDSIPAVGPISARARLHFKNRDLVLDEAKLNIGDSRAEGYLAFKPDEIRTTMQGTLDFDTIDLRPFFETQAGEVLSGAGWSTKGLQSEHLSAIDADMRISAKSLLLGKARVEDAALSILTRDNRVELSLGDGKLYDGQMTGRFVAETRHGGGMKTYGTLSLSDMHVDDALRESFNIVSLTGTGDVSLSISGEGGSASDIAGSLQGEARLRIKDGNFAGINMPALMGKARSNPVEAFLEARSGQTQIDSAIARFTIKNGIAETNDAVVLGPDYQVSLKGNATLADRKLDLKGVIRPPLDAKELFELPFAVRGPWNNPVIVPNPEALIQPASPTSN
ncbi:MAG: AsmA family protein [Pseudomonadota bacterium]